ncbi:1-acyl-sn-glycerol-3-phosphate acyltransferase alpha-like isoform X2 [Zootermopsis nevadensis]|uniref:1-acyl-sn-glycerol-3-phosphate acyltransferase alpha-like isoform X2 n=1 Tax=Zootermopsis nevadensis TaxID=136037 RepID=UPI000B8EAC61|nr:1-acyl-sn-glycerol-3-phosphate acyltransferase alpha-like isoform X2 [Zootermopsis nevadensis]
MVSGKPPIHWKMELLDLLPIFALVSILLLPFVYDSHGTFRYHSRFAFYIVSVSFTAMICSPFYCLNPFNVKNSLYTSYILRHVTKVLGIKWDLRGGEHLAEDRGCVIVANHQSMLDILGMFNIWHVMDKCAPVAKKEVFYVLPFGVGAWLAGVVFIDRLNSSKAHDQLNHAAKLMKSDKVKLWMFPEGTRNSSHSSLLPFKKGAFRVAITCQVPILPVVYSPYYFINNKKKFFGQGRMIIQALPEIPTKGLTMDDLDLLMKKTRDVMSETFQSLATEVALQVPPNCQ